MLVLTRKENQGVVIDGQIKVVIVEIRGNQVRLGIEAPQDIGVRRGEVERKEVALACDRGRP